MSRNVLVLKQDESRRHVPLALNKQNFLQCFLFLYAVSCLRMKLPFTWIFYSKDLSWLICIFDYRYTAKICIIQRSLIVCWFNRLFNYFIKFTSNNIIFPINHFHNNLTFYIFDICGYLILSTMQVKKIISPLIVIYK